MMNMEFLSPTYINTSTMVAVDSNTAGSAFLFDRRPRRQYKSIGYDNDLTTTSIRITFPNTVTISHIILQNVNWKQFTVFHSGLTASTFALTTTCGTNASAWTTNSATNLYLVLSSQTAVTSMTFDIKSTQSANEEKKCGQMIVAQRWHQLSRNPDIGGFQPRVNAKQVRHEMSDGGTIVYRIREKMSYDLTIKADTDDYPLLQTAVYDQNSEFTFTPIPTCTGWNGNAYQMVWTKGFQAGIKPTTNKITVGYDTVVTMEETPA